MSRTAFSVVLRRRAARMTVALATAVVGLGLAATSASATDFERFDATINDSSGAPLRQAGAHPDMAVTFIVTSKDPGAMFTMPADQPHRMIMDLPPGMVGNPTAVATCPASGLKAGSNGVQSVCPVGSQVGVANVYGGSPVFTFWQVPIYNVERPAGSPGLFAFNILGSIINLNPEVRPGDYGITVDSGTISQAANINGAEVVLWGVPADPVHDPQRYGNGPNGWVVGATTQSPLVPFLTLPTSCPASPFSLTGQVDGWNSIGQLAKKSFDADLNNVPFTVGGCESLAFDPSVEVKPTTQAADAPTGLDVNISVPQSAAPGGLATAHVKDVSLTLPEGVSVSPSSANGLVACTDAQIDIATDKAVGCADASKLGSVEIETPLLETPLAGSVYLGTQESDDPMSGKMFRIFLVGSGSGVTIKLAGEIQADPTTGRLTATFKNNPQMPFSALKVKFFRGADASLATPAACGAHTSTMAMSSWSGLATNLTAPFTVDCRAGLGSFAPSFTAGTINPTAGASSPFTLQIGRPDGQSALNGLSMTMPEGVLASLKGNLGTQVGTARAASGPGPNPFWLSGPVVLEGAYGDAPFSLRVTIPAIAGPFNLGDVVVRQKIYIDSRDAHVTIVSDPLPTIVKGVPIRLQRLSVNIDKAGFMKNPTNCAPKTINATLGAVTGQKAPGSSRFQVGDCANLALQPKMQMDLIGKKETKRGKHPQLSATMTQQPGESGLKKVKIRLPLSLALDPDNAQALCKPAEAAAKACPAGSIVGKATAVTPLLDQPLTGNVYFVEGTRQSAEGRTVATMPKLWVALRGQVALDVWADSSLGPKKELVTTFGFIPDAPISSFKLDIDGGAHGILAVTGASDANLCKQALTAKATYDGQNAKRVSDNVRMSAPCGFQVSKKSLTKTHAKVTVAGIGAGKLSISGKGIHKASRTIKSSSVATIKPRLTAAGMRTVKRGKSLRLRVSFNPKGKGKTRHKTTVVKPGKKAATR